MILEKSVPLYFLSTNRYISHFQLQKDLIKRLRTVLKVLKEDESIVMDSPEFPGLSSLCQALTAYVNHKDKEVRLYTVSSCMELFFIVSQ